MADRFEREIDEILKKIDDFPRGPAPSSRGGRHMARRISAMQRGFAVRLARISVAQVMLTAMGLIVFSYLFRAAFEEFWVYGLLLGLILFFTAFLLSFRGGSRAVGGQTYFRGRPRSYYESPRPSLGEQLKSWWLRQRRRR